jgi:hypothetical protein
MNFIDMGEQYVYDDYRYILCIIDAFTKQAFCLPMKNKTQITVFNKFRKLYKRILNLDKNITRIQTDRGEEFTSNELESFLKEYHIRHILSLPGRPQSNSIIERFNGTLKSLIHKYMHARNNTNWPEVLEQLVDNYNNTFHSSIRMSPNDAQQHQKTVYQNIQKNAKHFGKSYDDIELGDTVRIKVQKNKIAKHSTQNWSTKLYQVTKVVQPRDDFSSTKYFLDYDHKVAYSHNDIQKIHDKIKKVPREIKHIAKQEYLVDKIIAKKKVNNKMMYQVYWRGYKTPTWEPYDHIKDTEAYKLFISKK